MRGYSDGGAQRAFFSQLNGLGRVDVGLMISEISVDVPRVVFFGRVFESLKLVATGAGGERLELRGFLIEAGDAAGLRIEGDAKGRIFERQVVCREIRGGLLRRGNHLQEFVPE